MDMVSPRLPLVSVAGQRPHTFHSFRVSSHVTWPVRVFTSLYMCSVPPGPSPPPPFQRQMNRALGTPHDSVVYSSHKLQRSKGSTPEGNGPSSSSITRTLWSLGFILK